MAKKTRIKSNAYVVRYQDRGQVEAAISQIGYLRREIQRKNIEQNDEIALITEKYAPEIAALEAELEPVQEAVQAWCESNRDELTNNGRTKTGSFNTGEIQWRQRPPSVLVRGVDSVIEALRKLGLNQFIRTKEEINKEAMLNEPDIAGTVAGVTIRSGVEDFIITPFEQNQE